MAAYTTDPPAISVRKPVVIKKPVNIASPSKLPMKDILIRRSFDFKSSINNKEIVALRLAIFATLITQKGFGRNTCDGAFAPFWRIEPISARSKAQDSLQEVIKMQTTQDSAREQQILIIS